MKIYEFIKKASLWVQQENQQTEYTGKNYFVDLFTYIGVCKNNPCWIIDLFYKAYRADPKLALKILMYSRDIKSGLGKRTSFRLIFNSLCKEKPDVVKQLIPYVPLIGRYDDLLVGLETESEEAIIEFISSTLKEDLRSLEMNENVSLLAKWMPSVNTSNKNVVAMAKYLAKKLGMNEPKYRKMLSSLRKGKIIENNLREKEYEFDYNSVPSLALYKYKDAFLKNDKERYMKYLAELERRKGALKEHEYLYNVIKDAYDLYQVKNLNEQEKQNLEMKWNEFVKQGNMCNTIVVRDGSYSMNCNNGLPMLIANSMALYFSNVLKGKFANSFITFSSDPQLVTLNGSNLYSKLVELENYNDHGSISITKLYELLINKYYGDIKEDEMIRRIVIISDMGVDVGVTELSRLNTFKNMFRKKKWINPEIIYWHVDKGNLHYMIDSKYKNIKYLSGGSYKIIEALIENRNLEDISFIEECVDKYDFVDNLTL